MANFGPWCLDTAFGCQLVISDAMLLLLHQKNL